MIRLELNSAEQRAELAYSGQLGSPEDSLGTNLPNPGPGDWFFSMDLEDAYFHIQIAPHHRPFLRFAFKGQAYQYTVLPFGLSLAPRTLTKCMDAALTPLRQRGVRVLNYLDDWLIIAQSEVQLLTHRSWLLNHLKSAWASGSMFPNAHCLPARVFLSWEQ